MTREDTASLITYLESTLQNQNQKVIVKMKSAPRPVHSINLNAKIVQFNGWKICIKTKHMSMLRTDLLVTKDDTEVKLPKLFILMVCFLLIPS